MQLVTSLTSPFGRKLRVMLLEKGLPHELLKEAANTPGSRVPEFNPLGKVPALVTDAGETLIESSVIAGYIETLNAAPRFLPLDPLEAVRVRALEALADGVADAGMLVFNERQRPPELQSAAWIERQWTKVTRGLAALETKAQGRTWLHGDAMTLADITLACVLGWLDLRFAQEKIGETYPGLAAWAAPIAARASFRETEPPR